MTSDPNQPSLMRLWGTRLRWLVIGVFVTMLVVLLLQNLEPVAFDFLWTTVEMPRAVMLFVVTFAGFIIGALWGRTRRAP